MVQVISKYLQPKMRRTMTYDTASPFFKTIRPKLLHWTWKNRYTQLTRSWLLAVIISMTMIMTCIWPLLGQRNDYFGLKSKLICPKINRKTNQVTNQSYRRSGRFCNMIAPQQKHVCNGTNMDLGNSYYINVVVDFVIVTWLQRSKSMFGIGPIWMGTLVCTLWW